MIALHSIKALPLVPCGQLHIGTWFITLHNACIPHVPMHGSTHLFLIHALFLLQSVFRIHSGRQPE